MILQKLESPAPVVAIAHHRRYEDDSRNKQFTHSYYKQTNQYCKIPWELKRVKYHDLFFVLLFTAVVVGFIALSTSNVLTMWQQHQNRILDFTTEALGLSQSDMSNIMVLCGIIIAQSLVLCFVLILVLFLMCKAFIILGLLINLVLGLALAVAAFNENMILVSLLSLLLTLLLALSFWKLRKKINFSVKILKVVVDMMKSTACIWIIIFLQIITGWIFTILYSVLTSFTYVVWINNEDKSKAVAVMLFWLFAGYYVAEINRGVINVSVSSIMAKWYYNSSIESFKVISTILSRCFGSVCFGSLLVSTVQFARECLSVLKNESLHNSNPFFRLLLFIVDRLLSFLEYIMKYFNSYSFSYMSIHCTGYINSSSKIFKLLKKKGLDALINDCIIGTALKMYSIILLACAGVTAYWFTQILQPQKLEDNYYLATIIGLSLLLAYQIDKIVLEIITACVHTLFICFVEAPELFDLNHKDEMAYFKDPYDVRRNVELA